MNFGYKLTTLSLDTPEANRAYCGDMESIPGAWSTCDISEDTQDAGPSTSTAFEFTWQALAHSARYVNDQSWSAAPIPKTLSTYPETVHISPQLHRLLIWSLQRFENTPGEPPIVEPTLRIPEDTVEVAQEIALTRSNTVVSTATDETQHVPSLLGRAKSHRTIPLFARLHKLRQDVATKMASAGPSRHSTTENPQSSSQVMSEATNLPGECISCFDEFPRHELVHLDCSHDYCKPCLREVVFTAMKNEAAFPPKCCLTEIALKTVLVCLDKKQRDEYRTKSAEYAIPAGHRWYCPVPTCSKWIRPESLQQDRRTPQTCPHCQASICSMCRAVAHGTNQDCPQDFGLESTLEIAESEGWRRCYSCRTMVELTTGCRHITCRCGAEFCYVCNAIWRTCNCTEADKERRIRELRAQREERAQMQEEERRRREEEDEAARLEAEEMAEALRQVEELERQDAIRRVEEERRRQLEEELALALMEEARLLEEIARREEEEEAERQFRQILIASFKEECQAMMDCLLQIINHQHATLMSTHSQQEQSLVQEHEARKAHAASHSDTMFRWFHENADRRLATLNSKQKSEVDSLLLQIENEEDEMFMDMHIHLRGKPNREQREKKMRDAFERLQHERKERLAQQHLVQHQRHEIGVQYELEGLQKAAMMRVEPLEPEFNTALERFGGQVGCDRHWLRLVSTRRINMLNEHKRIVLEQLEAQQEPIGLTEEQARTIEPIVPALDDNSTAEPDTPLAAAIAGQLGSSEQEDLYGAHQGEHTTVLPPDTDSLSRSPTVTRHVPTPVSIPTPNTLIQTNPDDIITPAPAILTHQDYIATSLNSPTITTTKHLSRDSHSSSSPSTSTSTTTNPSSPATSITSTTTSLSDKLTHHTSGQVESLTSEHAGPSKDKGKGKAKGISGLFHFSHKKKEPLSDEEIRRRMSRVGAGDGVAGWGAFG